MAKSDRKFTNNIRKLEAYATRKLEAYATGSWKLRPQASWKLTPQASLRTENRIASPQFRSHLLLRRTGNPAKLPPLIGTRCTAWMSIARDKLPPRFASARWLSSYSALTCGPHLEGNPNMSWLLAALLTMFVGAPAPDCVIVEFMVDNCGPCRQLQPALEKLKSEGWDVRTVNADREPALVRKHAIESLPTLVLISNGKEVDRIVGAAPYEKILPRLAKLLLASHSAALGTANPKADLQQIDTPKVIARSSTPSLRTEPAAKAENWNSPSSSLVTPEPGITVRGQSPSGAFPMLAAAASSAIASPMTSQSVAEKFERLNAPTNQLVSNSNSIQSHGIQSHGIQANSLQTNIQQASTSQVLSRQPDRMPAQPPSQPSPSRNAAPIDLQKAIARAEAATVRIRVDEENSTAYGTGTVIDVHGDEALVLTCGHLFREMKPHSQLTIDLFPARAQPVNVPAQLIDFRADAGDVDIGLISFKLPFAIEPVPLLPQLEKLAVKQPAFSLGCDHGANPTRRDTQIKSINRYMGAPNVEIAGAPAVGRSGGGLFDQQGRLIGVCNAADAEGDEGIYAAAEIVYAQLERLHLAHLFTNEPTPQNVPAQPAVIQADFAANTPVNSFASSQSPANKPTDAQVDLASKATQITCIVRDSNGREQIVRVDSPSPELLSDIFRQANTSR